MLESGDAVSRRESSFTVRASLKSGAMIICQFIFAPGTYDDDFHKLDGQIDAYARSLPGFRATETWQSSDGRVINATYYFDDMASVRELSRFPQHLEAKGQYQRWYDGYRIVVSEVTASYGDDRLPHVTREGRGDRA